MISDLIYMHGLNVTFEKLLFYSYGNPRVEPRGCVRRVFHMPPCLITSIHPGEKGPVSSPRDETKANRTKKGLLCLSCVCVCCWTCATRKYRARDVKAAPGRRKVCNPACWIPSLSQYWRCALKRKRFAYEWKWTQIMAPSSLLFCLTASIDRSSSFFVLKSRKFYIIYFLPSDLFVLTPAAWPHAQLLVCLLSCYTSDAASLDQSVVSRLIRRLRQEVTSTSVVFQGGFGRPGPGSLDPEVFCWGFFY